MDGKPGVTRLGNTQLVEYGIRQEKSDIRAHVSVATKSVYVYGTSDGVAAINTGMYRKAPAYTGSIVTAEGYLVPPDAISGCKRIPIPSDLMSFNTTDSTSVKGDKAMRVVMQMLKDRLIPIALDVSDITDEMMQLEGTDIIVQATARVQVKCDWRAGPRELGGTGNLFVQVAECNPLNSH